MHAWRSNSINQLILLFFFFKVAQQIKSDDVGHEL